MASLKPVLAGGVGKTPGLLCHRLINPVVLQEERKRLRLLASV